MLIIFNMLTIFASLNTAKVNFFFINSLILQGNFVFICNISGTVPIILHYLEFNRNFNDSFLQNDLFKLTLPYSNEMIQMKSSLKLIFLFRIDKIIVFAI